MRATHLRTEYLKDPIGLGNPRPRFYWNCEGGRKQTAYQILCRRGDETVWNSGKVETGRMTHVRYEGKTLKSRDIVSWSIKLWDETGKSGEISAGQFELGLLAKKDWQADWISGDYFPRRQRRYGADCFRKRFKTNGVVVKARLYSTARGVYDVTINGRRIEEFILAPGMTDYRKRIQYQTFDVTELVRDHEENVLEVRLCDGWYRGSVAAYGVTNVFGKETSLLAQLEMTYADGGSEIVPTDNTWEWSNDGPLRFADLKDGEVYNATMAPSYSGHARKVTAPKAEICASDNVPVKEHEHFTPKLINDHILDFGQNIAGYLSFKIHGRKGQSFKIRMGERLDENGRLDMSGIEEIIPAKGWSQIALIRKLTQNKVTGKSTVTPKQEILFTCSGKEDVYKTGFAIFGFRYAEVTGDIKIDPEAFTAIAVYSDMEETGFFTCSDVRVNRLVENTRWSMKSNFLDVPTDCPTRERLGWTGDAQLFFNTGAYLMDTAAFMKKWICDMEDAQYKNGHLPAVIPYSGVEMMYRATGQSVGWADAVYLVPWRYYRRYGDREVLENAWPMMKKYADDLVRHLEKDGHYERGVHLGEWLEPEEFREKKYGAGAKHPEECTAYLYLAMSTIGNIAEHFGKTDDARTYHKAAERAKKVYPVYAETDTDRQAKLVRPLALGLLDGEAKRKTQERLKKALKNYRYRVGTGFLSTPFLLHVLTDAGYTDTAYKTLLNRERPGWLSEIDAGATSIWEDWEGKLSRNHYSPGAVSEWLFDSCAGIRVDGENHFKIIPVPGGELAYAGAKYRSLYGWVRSAWKREGSGIRYEIEIPVNCTAEIRLPGGKTESVGAGSYVFEERSLCV